MAGAERIGVLGVGRMGLPIATRLARAGFAVTVFDVLPARLGTAGLPAAPSAATLAAASDILVTVLPGMAEIEDAMIGSGRLVDSLPSGAIWLDLTSNDPRVARAIANELSARRVGCVGAPMAGGMTAAQSGTLRFYVGGGDHSVERARPVLESVGTVERVGESVEHGYVAKLLANLVWFGQVVAVTEALLLGKSLGLSVDVLRLQLGASAGGSVFIDEYLDRLLAGDYLASFGIDRCVEELETLVSLAEANGVPFELSRLVARQHRDALERFGAIDGELLAAKLLEERAFTLLRTARAESG
ncbi:MAG TPA: NAD(P)-binding domain-containing protein [Galbitalea sp.]|jgi:3-hydroxyisobutyrate dehydrogenase-like beta-hydroxyacid dehydrogenase